MQPLLQAGGQSTLPWAPLTEQPQDALQSTPPLQAFCPLQVTLQDPAPQVIGLLQASRPQVTVQAPSLGQSMSSRQALSPQLIRHALPSEQSIVPLQLPCGQSTAQAQPLGHLQPEAQLSWHWPPAQRLTHWAGHLPRSRWLSGLLVSGRTTSGRATSARA